MRLKSRVFSLKICPGACVCGPKRLSRCLRSQPRRLSLKTRKSAFFLVSYTPLATDEADTAETRALRSAQAAKASASGGLDLYIHQ